MLIHQQWTQLARSLVYHTFVKTLGGKGIVGMP